MAAIPYGIAVRLTGFNQWYYKKQFTFINQYGLIFLLIKHFGELKMNYLLDELKSIKFEVLQDEWDRLLIKNWKNETSLYMSRMVYSFLKDNNINYDDLKNMRRVPKYKRHQKCAVSRFISAYLPELNNVLFNKNNKDDAILKFMKNLKTLDIPIDFKKSKKEKQEMLKSEKESKAAFQSGCLVRNQREFSSRANWGHVK